MIIRFFGANRTVTGSCHYLELNGRRIVLDMGMYQGRREEARRRNEFVPGELLNADAVILSHAHLDHCGRLPILTRDGYRGPVYCTPATAATARVVLRDSAEIQEEDSNYLNRRARGAGEIATEPLYRVADLGGLFRAMKLTRYGQRVDLGNDVSFTFHDAGHILGSAYVTFEWIEGGRERSLLFTADIGRLHTPIIRDPAPLQRSFDHVITESTYGDRTHAPMEQVEPAFLDAVRTCIDRGGRMIVPAFAVGRTQTMLWYLQKFIAEKRIPEIPVFVDSPMGIEMSQVYTQHPDSYDAETTELLGKKDLFGLSHVTLASSVQQSKQINNVKGACVIIASSPTLEFGRVLHHVKRSIENERDMVVFVGWVPSYTLGRKIQAKEKKVRIYDRFYEPKIEVRTLHGLSAHADGDELARFLAPTLRPETTAYVVHGEADQSEALAAKLAAGGIGRAVVPAIESSVTG